MGQMHGSLNFAGESTMKVSTMQLESKSDTIVFSMNSASTGDIKIPEMKGGMQPIPSFTIKDATFTMGENHVVTFDEQTFSTTVTVDGVEKKVNGSSLTGEYNMADNSLSLKVVFKYGSMPLDMTYEVKAFYIKEISGEVKVVVGGVYTYENKSVTYKVRKYSKDGVDSVDVEIPEYKLNGTVMGDLTLGRYVVSGLAYDEGKQAFFRDYKNDGLSFHFTAESDGKKTMDDDYAFNSAKDNNITVAYTNGKVSSIVNQFQMGAMPFPIVSTFSGSNGATTGVDTVIAPDAKLDGQAYDLSGRRVSGNAKGIVIKNGKKYFFK